ncbi:MAG: SCO family protein [Alphaproteobacteria bacterium]
MSQNIKNRLIRTFIFSAIALVIGVGVGWYQIKMQSARVMKQGESGAQRPAPIAGLKLGGPFSLTDHRGEKVTEKTYDGQYKFIYFGFTYCPAICPTELQKVSQVMRAMEKNKPELAKTIQPLFITIDPARDTVPVMKDYVSLFHPRLIGLTGTQPQIDFVTKAYRVFARKVVTEEQQDYTMDHSSYLYLMSPDNQLTAIYRMDDGADFVYGDMLKRIEG